MVDLPTPIRPTSTSGRSIRPAETTSSLSPVKECALLIAARPIDALGRGQGIGLLHEDTKNLAAKRSAILWVVLLGLIGVLVAAWVDGGEEPLRPISQPVELPEGTL